MLANLKKIHVQYKGQLNVDDNKFYLHHICRSLLHLQLNMQYYFVVLCQLAEVTLVAKIGTTGNFKAYKKGFRSAIMQSSTVY